MKGKDYESLLKLDLLKTDSDNSEKEQANLEILEIILRCSDKANKRTIKNERFFLILENL